MLLVGIDDAIYGRYDTRNLDAGCALAMTGTKKLAKLHRDTYTTCPFTEAEKEIPSWRRASTNEPSRANQVE